MRILFSIPNSDSYFYHEAVDGEAAKIIAGIAAKNSGKTICPHIRECHRQCLSIVNLYPEGDPLKKLFGALDIANGELPPNERYEEYGVGVNCDRTECFTPIEALNLPVSLLRKDSMSCEQRINQLFAAMDAKAGFKP